METSSWVISTCRSAICAPASALACELAARSAPACGRAACDPARRCCRPWAALHHLQRTGAEILCGCAFGTFLDTATVLQLLKSLEVRVRESQKSSGNGNEYQLFQERCRAYSVVQACQHLRLHLELGLMRLGELCHLLRCSVRCKVPDVEVLHTSETLADTAVHSEKPLCISQVQRLHCCPPISGSDSAAKTACAAPASPSAGASSSAVCLRCATPQSR